MRKILGRPNINTQFNYRLQNFSLLCEPLPLRLSFIEAYLPLSRNKGKFELNQ